MARRRDRSQYLPYRSLFELGISEQLIAEGIEFDYETEKYQYFKKVRKGKCSDCDGTNIEQERWYLADFTFPGTSILIEAKGRLVATDRTKMKLVKEMHPELDIRMLFYADAKLPLKRTPTHMTWSESVGMQAAVGSIPPEWIEELRDLQKR